MFLKLNVVHFNTQDSDFELHQSAIPVRDIRKVTPLDRQELEKMVSRAGDDAHAMSHVTAAISAMESEGLESMTMLTVSDGNGFGASTGVTIVTDDYDSICDRLGAV